MATVALRSSFRKEAPGIPSSPPSTPTHRRLLCFLKAPKGEVRAFRAVRMRSARPKDFRSIPTATGGIARLACARLRELGKDVKAVLSKAGLRLEEIDDPAARLEVRTQIRILELAAEELGDDLLGFHLARSFDLREIGLVYYVMASSEQLADALRNAERFSRINTDGVRLRLKLDGTADVAIDYVKVDRGSDRHQIEFWLVALTRICRQQTAE